MAFEFKDIKNSIWLSAQYSVLICLSFIGLKLSLLAFGKSLFGVWLLLSSIFGFGGALDFGIGASVVRLVSSRKAGSPPITGELSNSFLIIAASGMLIALALMASAHSLVVSNPKILAGVDYGRFGPACTILGANFLCVYMGNFFRCAFEGLHRFKLVSVVSILGAFSQFAGILVIYLLKLDFVFLAIGSALGSALQFAVYAYAFRYGQKEITLEFKGITFRTMGAVLSGNSTLQAVTLMSTAIDPIIKYTIGFSSSSADVSVYEISRRFVVALSGIFSSSFRNTMPKVSALGSPQECLEFLSRDAVHVSRISVIYSIMGFGVLAPIFLAITERFYHVGNALPVFLILVLVESTNNVGYIYYTYIIGVKGERYLLLVQALNVVFTYVFLRLGFKVFHDATGILGFYLSVMIASALIFHRVSRNSGLAFAGMVRNSGWRMLLPFQILTGANILLSAAYPRSGMRIQLAYCGLCACVLFTGESRELFGKIKGRMLG